MTAGLLGLVTVLYVGVALSYWLVDENVGMALAFAGYAAANVGFIIAGQSG